MVDWLVGCLVRMMVVLLCHLMDVCLVAWLFGLRVGLIVGPHSSDTGLFLG